MKQLWPLLISVLLAAVRVCGVKHPAYQAVAHLWVGGLIGAWLRGTTEAGWRRAEEAIPASALTPPSFYLWLAVGLSVVELLCAIAGALIKSGMLNHWIEHQSRLYLWI